MRPLYTFLAGLVAALAVLGWIWGIAVYAREPERLVPPTASTAANTNLLRLTGATARLSAASPEANPTAYSQAVYAATQHEDKPGAVVLVREDDELSALTATRLQHMPVNAPMLFVTATGLPAATRAELRRLDPQGVAMDHNVQVYLVGNLGEDVARQVRALGRELGAPEPLWNKVPTADLLDGTPGQTDEAELGMTYEDIDDYLEGKDIPAEVAEKLEGIWLRSRHKRTTPVTIHDDWWR